MKLLTIAIALTVNFKDGGMQIQEINVSPNIAIKYDFKIMDKDGETFHDAFTAPLLTVLSPRVYDDPSDLEHETYHFWNHYSQMGLLFLPAYITNKSQFEDYLGTPFGVKNLKPKYYLFNWEEDKGFSLYKQLYIK